MSKWTRVTLDWDDSGPVWFVKQTGTTVEYEGVKIEWPFPLTTRDMTVLAPIIRHMGDRNEQRRA